jgi:hypothetical protein
MHRASMKKLLEAGVLLLTFLILQMNFSHEPLAQLVEHLTFNQRVEGSNPSWLIILINDSVQHEYGNCR